MPKPTLIVMAAGIGSRYGGLKQIDPVGPNGEIIIDYSIYDALKAGFGKVVFVIKKDIEAVFRERVSRNIERHCETAYVFQSVDDLPAGFEVPPDRRKPWGTGHAVLSCRNVVRSPCAVINADDFYGTSSYQILYEYLEAAQDRDGVYDYCMVGFVLENTLTEHGYVSRGVCRLNRDGTLDKINERKRVEKFGHVIRYTEDGEHWVDIPRASIASMNMWGFTPSVFSELQTRFPRFLRAHNDDIDTAEFFLPEIISDLVVEKRATVKVLATNERWIGVTYKNDVPRVTLAIRDLIHRGIYPENLWQDRG